MSDQEEQSTSLAGLAHGQLCYLQIPAHDVAASARFYGRVFGWRVDPPGAGFEAPGLIGEWTTDRPPAADAGPLGWMMVRDVAETLGAAERAGGTVRQGPIPDGPRRLASFLDPAGNLVGIAQHADPPLVDNRTMPAATVFPVLVYDDVPEAIAWLCAAFGFTERWHADAHRAVLEFPGGAVMLGERDGGDRAGASPGDSVMVRVPDADAHCAQARRAGARVVDPPRDFPYGERQYGALDIGGHRWTFSQSIADRVPEEWGGTSGPALPRPEGAENGP
jgi:predicted enzyme related to lactoylglutathione lyase